MDLTVSCRLSSEGAARLDDLVGWTDDPRATASDIVRDLIDAEHRRSSPPNRDAVLTALKDAAPAFRAAGASSAWLYGSVADRTQHCGSDVNVMVEGEPRSAAALVELATDLSLAIGAPVRLRPISECHEAVLASARHSKVDLF